MWVHKVNPNFSQTNHRVSLHHLHFGLFYIPCNYSCEFELCFRSIYLGVLYLCVWIYLF